ncbi:hypothetical protein [Pectobacterium brasiliense]|uniref:hypothetical protein n=1 Tax=Pectobacterium brasiliense TaxID=180957 RepID=UPI00068BF5CA|nr:hypothetical protein [Pectobacterium brasiliense]
MTLIEMEGFLRGKCIPRDMLVNESNAQYLLRKLTELQKDNETLRAMMREVEIQRDKFDAMLTEAVQSLKDTEKQRDALAVENAALKVANKKLISEQQAAWPIGLLESFIAEHEPEIPATDAAIAEIGAKAVDELLKSGRKFFMYSDETGFEKHKTKDEAIKSAQEMIDVCREDADDGWPEETDTICWGVIIQMAEETDFQKPSKDNGFLGSSDYKLRGVGCEYR